jgi:hypothetical protein
MTDAQRHVWDWCISSGTLTTRICNSAVRIKGALDVSLLRDCLDAVIARHEALRTTFVVRNGVPVQNVSAGTRCDLQEIEIAGHSQDDRVVHATELANRFITELMDVRADPLFEVRLLTLSPRDYVLIIAIHHMVADAESLKLIDEELWNLYGLGMQRRPLVLAERPLQFGDYAVWQDQTRDEWFRVHANYWRDLLSGAPCIEIPVRYDAQPVYVEAHIALGSELSIALASLARREKSLLALVVFAAYVAALSRMWGYRDLVIKTVANNRDRPELMNVVGFIIDVHYVRVAVSERTTFVDLLRQLGNQVRAASEHPTYARLADIIPQYYSEQSFNWVPLNWTEGTASRARNLGGDLEIEPFRLKRELLPCKFGPMVSQTSSGVVITLYHRLDCVSAADVDTFGRDLRMLCEKFVRQPMSRIATV